MTSPPDLVRLRAHHLLCLLTYVGKGYSADFVANYDRIATRLALGAEIELVGGPDDICAPLLATCDPHCRRPGVTRRDDLAARDLGALLERDLWPGARLTLDAATLARLRAAFAPDLRAACAGCKWSPLCTDIAARGFTGARIDFEDIG